MSKDWIIMSSPLMQHLVDFDVRDMFKNDNLATSSSAMHNNFSWTKADHLRLIHLDELYSRSIAFHNNLQTFHATVEYNYTAEYAPCAAIDIVAEVLTLGRDMSNVSPWLLLYKELHQYLQRASTSKDCFHWISVHDPRTLECIGEMLSLHQIAIASFFDLRCHSTILPVNNALFFTLCFPKLDGHVTRMFKFYAYCDNNILVTYECEILAESETNPCCLDSIASILQKRLSSREAVLLQYYGALYLIYEVCLEAQTHINIILTYLRRAAICLKEQVHRDLSYAEKLVTHRKIHMVISVITMFKQLTEALHDSFEKLKIEPAEFLLSPGREHAELINSLQDIYQYSKTFLHAQQSEMETIRAVLAHVQTVRAEKISVNLALIATLFLPLTFLAGIFGMNFQRHGNYTIPLLNDSHGPLAFWLMCIGVLVINLILFTRSGYITWKSKEYYNHQFDTIDTLAQQADL